MNCGPTQAVRKRPYRFDIVVQALSLARGPASEAHKLYRETSESVAARETLAAQLRDVAQPASKGTSD